MGSNMQILVRQGDRITAFQRKFREMFPYLRIEFAMDRKDGPAKNGMDDLLQFSSKDQSSDKALVLTTETNFADLAADFQQMFGLNAKLYRKVSTSWIETIHTHNWSLQDQNNQGQQMSGFLGEIHDDRP